MIFLSIDTGDNNAQCLAFENTYQTLTGCKFPSASGTQGGGNAVCSAYGITAYPTVILIAPNKTIVERDIWPIATGQYLATLIEGHGGIPAPVGINEVSKTNKTSFITSFPNPANNLFNIQFNVEENSTVYFEVLNLLGEKVITLPANEYISGSHSIQIPVENLSNGTYLVNLISNNVKKDMCKMVIVK